MRRNKNLDRMRDFLKSISQTSRRRPPPPRRKGGGSEPVTVEPDRPRLGEGGAAAALEFERDEDAGHWENQRGKVAGNWPVPESPE